MEITQITELMGRTAVNYSANRTDDVLEFTLDNGDVFRFYHYPDCCESVVIEEIIGNLDDLLDTPFIEVTEVSTRESNLDDYESATWTFYHFRTVKGAVTVRWSGTSNGFYSESVQWELLSGPCDLA